MKLKNVKKGTRVVLKEDYNYLVKGMVGTILEDNTIFPYISWDNWNGGHNMTKTSKNNSCYAVYTKYLKRIKE